MGKGQKSRSKANLVDSNSDNDSMSSNSTGFSDPVAFAHVVEHVDSREHELEKHLDALYEKRASTREKALLGLIELLENNVLHEFVENKSFTMLQQLINSIKRGSSKEVSLASRAIGLLTITVGFGANAHEIMDETVPHLYQALKSGSDSLIKNSSPLDCLAVVSFIGADAAEEMERSMRIIWELIHPKSASNITLAKPTPAVLASSISAWSFLLTTVYEWRNNSTDWQESISFLSNLLDKDDRSVRIAAGEALALIFEIDRLDKFSRVDNSNGGLKGEVTKPHAGIAYIEALKGKILNQARDLSVEAAGKGSGKADLSSQRELFQRIVYFVETGEFDEFYVKVLNNCSPLKLSTWAQSIQLNFLKRFLGSGYLKHMLDNELLHEVFDYIPKKRVNLSIKEKRMFMSPNSLSNKERTQYLNKQRALAQDRNQGLFVVDLEDN